MNNLFSSDRVEPEEPLPGNMTSPVDENFNIDHMMDRRLGASGGGFFSSKESGLLFGDSEVGKGGVIGVNSYLWRASLDTISFMPIKTADAFGGVILTDWHSPAESPNERFKLNVYILDRALRADGIRVAVFRQVLDKGNQWRDAAITKKTARQIEDAILTRARQIRLRTVAN
ncbi:MAG: DUF3576 domain-containing protein [Rhodospirillales bacterium]